MPILRLKFIGNFVRYFYMYSLKVTSRKKGWNVVFYNQNDPKRNIYT